MQGFITVDDLIKALEPYKDKACLMAKIHLATIHEIYIDGEKISIAIRKASDCRSV